MLKQIHKNPLLGKPKMTNLEKFPEELGEYLRPLWKIINDLQEADSDFRRLTATFHIINFYSCVPDPTPVHFRVVREYLESQGISDNKSIDVLVRELFTHCQKFQQLVVTEFSAKTNPITIPMYEENGKCLMPNKNKLRNSYWRRRGAI